MPIRKQFSVVAVSLLILSGVSASLNAQSAPSPQEAITSSQLKVLLTETKALQTEKADTRQMLRTHYEQLPNWFPVSLKNQISGRFAAANPVKVDLPIYQKYLTRQQADQLNLFFQGSAGEAVAAHVSLLTAQADFAALVRARLNQLDPQQRAAISEALTAFLVAQPKIAADRNIAFETAYEKAMHEVISQNRPEYDVASAGPLTNFSGPTTDGFKPR